MLKWLVVFLLITSSVFAQNRAEKEGDHHFKHFKYYESALAYKRAYERDTTNYGVAFKLAETYKAYFNYTNAENYYKIVSENALEKYPMSQFWYAEMQKLLGEYEESKVQFEKLLADETTLAKLDKGYAERAKVELEGCKMVILELQKPKRDYEFRLLDGSVNSKGSEYAPVIYQHDSSLVFTSNKSKNKHDPAGGINNHFRVQKVGYTWEEVDEKDEDDFYKIVNSKFNEGAGSFTSDKKKYYFTRCDGEQKHSEFRQFNCLIYVTKKKEGKWQEAEPLNHHINTRHEWTANPSVSPRGDTLFFVSKRDGGKGMHDIWYSVCHGNDHWQRAINLEHVNTPFVDISPIYDPVDKALYFSSNGRESFGGLDIYIAKGQDFADIHNIGLPFNSNMDDFYFVVGRNKGYLASNRDGGIGNDDIYWFNKKSKQSVIVEVDKDSLVGMESVSISAKIVSAGTHKPIADLKEILLSESGEELKTTRTNEEGVFRFDNLDAHESYKVVVADETEASIADKTEIIVENIEVKGASERLSDIQFENIYFDFNLSILRPEALKVMEHLIVYYNEHPTVQIEIHANTDDVGASDYNIRLSHKRGLSAYRYLVNHGVDKSAIVINAKGEDAHLVPNYSEIGRQLNRRVEFYIIGGGAYSPEAMTYIIDTKTSLHQVANKFNMTIDELKEMNNIDADHVKAFHPLRVRNIGDDDLIEPVTFANASKKNNRYYKKQHKRIVAYKQDYKTLNATYTNYNNIKKELKINEKEDYYVALYQNTLWRIAKLYGMSVEELRELNGLSSNLIMINQPIIVVISDAVVEEGYYRSRKGESLETIAEKFDLSIEQLIGMNLLEGYTMRHGMILKVK